MASQDDPAAAASTSTAQQSVVGVEASHPHFLQEPILTHTEQNDDGDYSDGRTYPSRRLHAGEIRLLYTQPGRYKAPVACRTKIFRLTTTDKHRDSIRPELEFEALSYTWGRSDEGHTIRLNDVHNLPVTDNLWYALRRLRLKRDQRALWIDAVAINQRDDEEKAHQVARMMYVFRCASRVLVWLGEPGRPVTAEHGKFYGCSDSITTLREYFSRQYRSVCNDISLRNNAKPSLRCKLSAVYETYRGWEVLRGAQSALLSTPFYWYHRIWVIQEVAVAQQVDFCIGSQCLRG